MPTVTDKKFISLSTTPTTTAPYPGRGSFTVEFGAIVIAPLSKTIQKVRGGVTAEAKKYTTELAAASPVGHTKNLSRRWKLFTTVSNSFTSGGSGTNAFEVYCRISNTAPNAFFRIVGRAPGKLPPIRALKAWAKKKGYKDSAAYAIQRKIAKFGTERYRTGNNMAGLNPGVNPNTASYSALYRSDNIVTRFLERLERRLK